MGRFILLACAALLTSVELCRAQTEIEESVAGMIVAGPPEPQGQTQRTAKHADRQKARGQGSKREAPPIWEQNGPQIDPNGINGY